MNLQALDIESIIASKKLSDDLLLNSSWEQVDFYRFCSDSKFWGCAHINILSKVCTSTSTEAFVFLLQAERIHLKYLKAEDNLTILSLFNSAIADGYFANPKGEIISKNEFQNHYDEIINAIKEDKEFEVYINGQQQLPAQTIQIDDILFVTAYSNEWNSRQYFVETKNAWLLFGWATMA